MSAIDDAARRTVGKPIAECDTADLDRIIAAGVVRIAELTDDATLARALRDRNAR